MACESPRAAFQCRFSVHSCPKVGWLHQRPHARPQPDMAYPSRPTAWARAPTSFRKWCDGECSPKLKCAIVANIPVPYPPPLCPPAAPRPPPSARVSTLHLAKRRPPVFFTSRPCCTAPGGYARPSLTTPRFCSSWRAVEDSSATNFVFFCFLRKKKQKTCRTGTSSL